MRAKALVVGVLATVVAPGCTTVQNTVRNVFLDPVHFPVHTDNLARHVRDKHLAAEAWEEILARDGVDAYSKHYARGFSAGFRDYLDAGGNCEPPLVPPRSYWRLFFQTPEGHQAMQDWFAGFRHGAIVARESGYRELVTVDSSYVPPEARCGGGCGPAGPAPDEGPPVDETLGAPLPKPPGVVNMPGHTVPPAAPVPARPSPANVNERPAAPSPP